MTQTSRQAWSDRWKSKAHHELTLADYVGPFPVGPAGYRRTLANMIAEQIGQAAEREWEEHEQSLASGASSGSENFHNPPARLENPHRPDLTFVGTLRRGAVYALDTETKRGLGAINSGALGVVQDRRGEGIPEELYWLISEGRRAGDPAVRHTMDYSLGGFKARVRAHELILNRIEDKSLIPDEVMKDYETGPDGKISLAIRYDPEDHNAFWGVDYDPRCVEDVPETPGM